MYRLTITSQNFSSSSMVQQERSVCSQAISVELHAEVWATDTIPADLPPMVEFKAKADAIILERWGIEVEHVCAMTTYDSGKLALSS